MSGLFGDPVLDKKWKTEERNLMAEYQRILNLYAKPLIFAESPNISFILVTIINCFNLFKWQHLCCQVMITSPSHFIKNLF